MRDWMKHGVIGIICIIVLSFLGYGSYIYYSVNYSHEDYENFDEDSWENPLDSGSLIDNKRLYDLDKPLEVEELYVTVLPNQKNNESFYSMIRKNDLTGEKDLKLDIFLEGEEKNIINNGLYVKNSNATIEVKGKSSQESSQKSFKISLAEKAGLWNGQNIINLNKCQDDTIRVRDKLSYEYMSLMPNMISFQTSFVRVFIRDLSEGNDDAVFEDYGFFTQVEQPNKLFMKSHGLDPSGQLYKAEDFNFSPNDALVRKNSEKYSKKDFENVLEIKGSDDHEKLINLVNEVNNYDKNINEIIDKYFYMDNYLEFLAVNILFENYQIDEEDYFLYSSLNSDKWYFIPWDYDNAWGNNKDLYPWQKGVQMLWDNVLHRRFLSEPGNLEKLNDKMEELDSIINEEQTKKLMDRYTEIILANLSKLPDLKYLPVEFKDLQEEIKEIPDFTNKTKAYYFETIENPMPFSIINAIGEKGVLAIKWGSAVDLQGDKVTYDIEVSKDESFEKVDYKKLNIESTEVSFSNVPKGEYYIRIVAKDSKGNSQILKSIYEGAYNDYIGVFKVYVK